MTYSYMLKQYFAGLAILLLVVGCNPDDGGSPASANDFGGSGVVLNTLIVAPFVLFQNDSVSRLANRDGERSRQTV